MLQERVSCAGQVRPLQELRRLMLGERDWVNVPHPIHLLHAFQTKTQSTGQQNRLQILVSFRWCGQLPPQDCMSVIFRVRVVEPPLQDLLQEVHVSQLPTLHWTGKQLHRRLLRRLQAFEGVITTANTIRVRNRVEKRVISRKTICYLQVFRDASRILAVKRGAKLPSYK